MIEQIVRACRIIGTFEEAETACRNYGKLIQTPTLRNPYPIRAIVDRIEV